MRFHRLVVAVLVSFASLAQGKPQVSGMYNRIGKVTGQVIVREHGDLRRGPAAGAFFVMQRAGCAECLIGVQCDIEGRYTVFVATGKYKIYYSDPARGGDPPRDLLAKGQPREVVVLAPPADTQFNIELDIGTAP